MLAPSKRKAFISSLERNSPPALFFLQQPLTTPVTFIQAPSSQTTVKSDHQPNFVAINLFTTSYRSICGDREAPFALLPGPTTRLPSYDT